MINKIKIAILDDHALFNAGLVDMISETDRYEVVRTFTVCKEFLEWASTQNIEILITDLNMPDLSGVEIIKLIRRQSPKTKILVVSSISNEYSVKKCFLLGANGYLLKTMDKSDLFSALDQISLGNYYLASEVHQYLIQGVLKNEDLKNLVLTNREMEIIQLICEEFTSREIAKRLTISEFTVSNHRKSILNKLGVKNVAGIMKFAILNGLT
jgi:DNA-binding NarL/FixJ family response regulator